MKTKASILSPLIFLACEAFPQCVPPQPQNLQATANPNGSVTVQWRVPCPSACNNSANTSVLFFIGFYSQQSAAPNSLDGEYGFTSFIAVGCQFTELWDGFYRDSNSTADPKRSPCVWTLMGQDVNPFIPGFERSFSLQDVCNNTYGFGAGIMRTTFPASSFCNGVTYDVKVWTIEVNVRPNGNVTSQTIACNNLYLSESQPVEVISAFTYRGLIAPIAAPRITISNSKDSDGVYQGVNNRIIIDCTDTFSFEYSVTPGCNFTESVAAYFNISNTYTYGAGVYNPWDWGLDVRDWYIFFANNIVDASTGLPRTYVGNNYFASFTVSEDMEVCILTQDPCNGSSGKTCIQFEAVDFDTVIADFGYNLAWSNGCDSFLVEFINNTTGAIDYYWDFGDGAFSSDSTLNHLFVGNGPFDVMLAAIHTGWCGNNDTVTKTLSFDPVIDTARVNFSYSSDYTSTCDSLMVRFIGQLQGSASLLWDFGNGQTSTGINPTVTYTTPGDYTVTVVSLPHNHCLLPDTFTEQVTFTPLVNNASANFEYDIAWTNNCDSFMVEFTNLSTGAASYYWDFGNGVISSDTNLTQLFSAGGPFTVMLAAYHGGDCGRNDTIFDLLAFTPVIETLVSDFSFAPGYSPNCDSLIVQFSAMSSAGATFSWNFGNGQTASGSNASAVYSTHGTYDITLIATPTVSCNIGDTVVKPVTFNPLSYNSIADFDYNIIYKNDCDTFIVEFTNLSSGGTSYFWDFGNGITSNDTNFVITYTAGNFDVTLQVNDSRNCSTNDTVVKPLLFTPVIITPKADFEFVVTPNCDYVELELTNTSEDAVRFIWQLNNQVIGNDFSPNAPNVFYQSATLGVSLTARGANNCASDDAVSKTIDIPSPYGYPSADFDFTPPNPQVDEPVLFTNLSQRADPTRYRWSFGDGAVSTQVNPRHTYMEKGEYEICLDAENEYGCPDEICKWVEIFYTAIVDLPNAFTPNGDDHNDVFIVRGKDIEKMHLRIFNRWGELVFESRDPNFGWDGTYKDKPQEMEVYDWLLNATLKNGQDIFRKGNVTLLR